MKQDQAADAQRRAESQQQFGQGLQMAQTDALNRFKQDYGQKADELAALEGDISGLQQESLMAQQAEPKGYAGCYHWGALSSLRLVAEQQIKSARRHEGRLGGKPQVKDDGDGGDPFDARAQSIDFSDGQPIIASDATRNPELQFQEGMDASNLLSELASYGANEQAEGGSVQQTPGEYDHDTNDMILMAQGARSARRHGHPSDRRRVRHRSVRCGQHASGF